MSRDTVENVIRKFGSQQRVAELLGIWQTAVSGWVRRGAIPARRQEELLAIARREGLRLSPADFFLEAELPMAAVAGAETTGRQIGRDFDLVAKEAMSFLHRFRRGIIVFHEDVGRAGEFLARAVMAAIERRAPEQGQFIDTPTSFKSD